MRDLLTIMTRNMKVLVGGLFLLGCIAVIASAKQGSGEETITHKVSWVRSTLNPVQHSTLCVPELFCDVSV
jgi:hypothetical protein